MKNFQGRALSKQEVETAVCQIKPECSANIKINGTTPTFNLPLRDSTPCRPKAPPLYYFEISIFGDGPQKLSQSAFGANIYLFSEGSARRKNATFLVKVFQKVPKNAFFGLFFQNFSNFWPKYE